MAGLPEGFDVNDPICPDCGGPMWDNRSKKRSGDYNAKRSDFSCKDKGGCGKGLWIASDKKAAAPAGAQGKAAPVAPRPVLTPEQRKAGREKMISDYFGLMKIAAERMEVIAKQHSLPLDMAHVQAATYSVFAKMSDKGYLSPPAAAARAVPAEQPAPVPRPAQRPAPRPAPAAVPSSFEEFPGALEEDDDLPF